MSYLNWENSITLVIPTVSNRIHLLEKTLKYLQLAGFLSPIIISDHSQTQNQGIVLKCLDLYPKLNIKLIYHPPDMHFLLRLADCAEKSDTPYFQLHADDDFLCKAGLAKAVEFLNNNPDYSGCLGDTVNIIDDQDGIKLNRSYNYHKIDPDVSDRVFTQLMCYSSVLYSLRRTIEVIDTFRQTVLNCPDVIFWQYLESILCVFQGKIEVMDFPWLFRGVHNEKWSIALAEGPLDTVEVFPFVISQQSFPVNFSAFIKAVNKVVGISDYFENQKKIISKAERKRVNKFCSAYSEFLMGRIYSDRVGKFFMSKNPAYIPRLGELSHNLRSKDQYMYVISLIKSAGISAKI